MSFSSVRQMIRSILLPIGFSAIGLGVVYALKTFCHVELPKSLASVIIFLVTSLCVILLFPKVYKIPFGKVSISDFMKNVGLSKPPMTYKFVLLGIVAAIFTLSGMLIGSMLTGKYIFSFSTITLSHAIFCLTPGIWEEVLFRGVLMIVLLRLTKSYKKAFIIQIIVFGLVHIKGFDLLSFVDAFSVLVIAIAFTYIALKTRSLIPGIVFHYLHDTFLFSVQLPDGDYVGFQDNALFYGSLWLAIIVSIIVIKNLSGKYSIVSNHDFYGTATNIPSIFSAHNPIEINKRKDTITRRSLLFNSIGFSVVLFASINECNMIVLVFLSIYILTNVLLYCIWERVKDSLDYKVHFMSAVMAFVNSYDTYSRGSRQVYIAWVILGLAFIILAMIYYLKKVKRREVQQ
jgi:hypothetical protein